MVFGGIGYNIGGNRVQLGRLEDLSPELQQKVPLRYRKGTF